MRRGILGGSFDPIHIGHVIVAEAAAAALGLDVVHLIPTSNHPFKRGTHHASAQDRLAMLRLAVEGRPLLQADSREVDRGGVSYTADTLKAMTREYEGDALFLMVGADAAEELPEWREAALIRALAEIVVLTRPGAPPTAGGARQVTVPAVPVSATQVRESITQGDDIAELVPPLVAAFIASHGLYAAGYQRSGADQVRRACNFVGRELVAGRHQWWIWPCVALELRELFRR